MKRAEAFVFEEAARTLAALEQRVLLIQRAQPRNAASEAVALVRAFSHGRKLILPRVQPVDLAETRRALERVSTLCEPLDWFGRLHAERARELELEAELVEALDGPRFGELAARRFPLPQGALGRDCDAFVTAALGAAPEPDQERYASDDAATPRSLISRLRARGRELGISLNVRIVPDQLTTAATGDGLVTLRPRVMLSADAAERIAVHELYGHALPRARARHADWTLFRVGTAGAADDEEGRALLCEERAGLFGSERRRELALRHVAASGVRSGASPRQTVSRLVELGAPLERAVDLMLRVHRGGGLGRGIVYLPRYIELGRAFVLEPALERWFERGRVGLEAARIFSRTPPPPACDPKASLGGAAPHRSPPA